MNDMETSVNPPKNPEEALERDYDRYNQNDDGTERAARTILAYMYWQDGAEWDFVEEVWFGDSHWTWETCTKELAETFGYETKFKKEKK
jgi:hypothetical protein